MFLVRTGVLALPVSDAELNTKLRLNALLAEQFQDLETKILEFVQYRGEMVPNLLDIRAASLIVHDIAQRVGAITQDFYDKINDSAKKVDKSTRDKLSLDAKSAAIKLLKDRIAFFFSVKNSDKSSKELNDLAAKNPDIMADNGEKFLDELFNIEKARDKNGKGGGMVTILSNTNREFHRAPLLRRPLS